MAQQTGSNDLSSNRRIPKPLQCALCITALAWAGAATLVASRAAAGIAGRFHFGLFEGLLDAIFLLFLVVVGFKALDWVAARGFEEADVLPLPRRAGWMGEWGLGAAIGWGLSLACVLPVLISLHIHSRLELNWAIFPAILTSLLTLLVATLAQEAIFRGYPFRRLADALGPSWAAVLLSVGFGVVLISAEPPRHVLMALFDGAAFGLVLTMAYLRTYALWTGWGLHFGYRAVTSVVLGLPIAGHGAYGTLTDTYVSGPRWLTGGAFGLDAAFLTVFAMLGGMVVLYRATQDYAWKYTHPVIVPGGYEVTVAPPAAHVAMEKAAAPPPLVQILATTPQTRSREDLPRVDADGNLMPRP